MRFLMPLVFAACGSSMTVEGNVVRAPNGASFRLGEVPGAWHRLNVDDSAVGFNDPDGSSIMVAGRCKMKSDDVPLVALTNQLVAGTTDRSYEKEDTITFDGREARHTVLRAKLDGVPMVWDVYVMKKNGCVYDLAYVAAPEAFSRGAESFERFASGFRTIEETP
ncbi:MAG TPA: hypothetical protein VGH28_30460 [Polyangiaceae bacterium]